ncbi:MAG: zf-HC2 domain-containing protein [Pyrinomonadaceae bacterium]|nr:zf-HC2 domain-containing protein [Pyrinomonadaceae bacterium]
MGCDQNEKISLLIDGELATEEARSLELHLSTCSQCNQVRNDFLGLRSQISSYALSEQPSLPRPALAKVLAKSQTRSAQTGWRLRFLGLGEALRLNAQFATVAALVLLTLVIGSIAFLRYRPRRELVTNNPATANSGVGQPSRTPDAQDQLAKDSGRKPPRGQPRETGPARRKSYPPIKPGRERSAPKPLPQLQNAAPPNYALVNRPNGGNDPASIRSGDTEALTMSHFEQSELLLRAFRNLRASGAGRTPEIAYERRRAQQLLYRNIMLQREADSEGDVQVATLLGSLEPILLDIANLRDRPRNSEVQLIKDRVERSSLVPLLQINSMAVTRAND